MPERIREKHPESIFRIPMLPTVRSLNLASAAGIVLYEAIRQLGIPVQAATVDDLAGAPAITHEPNRTRQ